MHAVTEIERMKQIGEISSPDAHIGKLDAEKSTVRILTQGDAKLVFGIGGIEQTRVVGKLSRIHSAKKVPDSKGYTVIIDTVLAGKFLDWRVAGEMSLRNVLEGCRGLCENDL